MPNKQERPEKSRWDSTKESGAESLLQRRRKNLEKPFTPRMVKLLFVIELLASVGFGVLEIITKRAPGTGPLVSQILLSLLISSFVAAVPLVGICLWQLWRIKNKKAVDGQTLYYICGGITLGILALLFLGWLVTLIIGI